MPKIARLLIELDEVSPPVRRRVEVPLDIGLDDLHLVIQAAMGWGNDHLYEFRFGSRRDHIYSALDPDLDPEDEDGLGDSPLSAERVSLAEALARRTRKGRNFKYVYDFGDNWRHTVRVEARAEAAPDMVYPRLLSAERACPPEDIGGPWGYAQFLEVIADPDHERHEEMIEWCGEGFDPEAVDEAAIQARLTRIGTHLAEQSKRTTP